MYKYKYLKYKHKYSELLKIHYSRFNIGQIVKLKNLTLTSLNGSYVIIKESLKDGRYLCFIIHKISDENLEESVISKIKTDNSIIINQANIEICEELNNFDNVIKFILNILTIKEREQILANKLEKIFTNNIPKISNKLFICMCLMVGSFRWNGDNNNDFNKWIHSTDEIDLSFDKTIACFESVLYGLYLLGITTKEKIKETIPYYKYAFDTPEFTQYKLDITNKIIISIKNMDINFNENTKENKSLLTNLVRLELLMIPLGCTNGIIINQDNMIQDSVNICYIIRKNNIHSDELSYIKHYFLAYNNYAIQIDQLKINN
jgi:hypothetical protein